MGRNNILSGNLPDSNMNDREMRKVMPNEQTLSAGIRPQINRGQTERLQTWNRQDMSRKSPPQRKTTKQRRHITPRSEIF